MKRFLLRLFVWALVPVLLLFSLFAGILIRTGELTSPGQLIQDTLTGKTTLVEPLYFGGEFQNWYKAQVAWAKGAEVLVLGTSRTMQIRGCMPVSYTHLDVYKRQAVSSALAKNESMSSLVVMYLDDK